ncbi:MAG: hypothetical protein AAFX08_01990 [Pseudomonadota bacterium]
MTKLMTLAIKKRAKSAGLAAFTACALGIASEAAAQLSQAPVTQPSGLLRNFDLDAIEPLARELSSDIQRTTIFGRPALRVGFGDKVLVLAPNACDEATGTDCAGLFHFMFFPKSLTLGALNDFNAGAVIGYASNAADGTSMMMRYTFCDFGCARGTVAVSMLNYLGAADRYMDALNGAGRAVEVADKIVQANSATAAEAKTVSFSLDTDGHGLEGVGATRLRDWIAGDLFSGD